MKKLAKPIELKGRIIRYAPEVHLKKKKTATKTGKKIGKKMMGGYVKMTGIPSVDDFLIRKIPMELFEKNTTNILEGHSYIKYHIDREETQDVKVITNFASQEPYLFFYPESSEMSHATALVHPNYRYYQYLAFNSGFGNSKEAIFKKLGYIQISNDRYDKNVEDVPIISEIPQEALIQLRDFIFVQRTPEHPTFCNTIYTAVVERIRPPAEQQQHNNE
jgi:hypothetical protein